MICPSCEHDNPEEARFCNSCGSGLESSCPACGQTNPVSSGFCCKCGARISAPTGSPPPPTPRGPIEPTSFSSGRYQVKKKLGEGGKKKVYLAHDTTLDRDVAFALVKTEELDESGHSRIIREAQALGRLGSHPHIVTVHDLGDEDGQPYMVTELMDGGDVEQSIKNAPEHRIPLEQAIDIAKAVSRGLEFAHSKGILHRDIKPGNVWLTSDGIAKVGDFGLALAMDRSRLTEEGMMVGTVSYMAPEQATGGEVTPRSDLYSLGAMLHELVTGRPPFVGDGPVAIIGQHLNTTPVAPSWHVPDLPAVLEDLILRLLEKDVAKRPASATDVLNILDSIDLKSAREPTVEEASIRTVQTPLYRRAFVGREAELAQLRSAFDGARSGHGALFMVVGEPGIGKTGLCEQLATYVSMRGGKTLVGHCYEEGSLSLPYLPFVEAMRTYVLSKEREDLKRELGSGAESVARIISEIRERAQVEVGPPGDPEEERYRLMQAVTDFLRDAAQDQPLVLVLEDLHDTDRGTLDMLGHLARRLSGARLLVVGTYRDVEVDRAHPLSGALADLHRASSFGRVLLRGLAVDEVHRMVEAIATQEVPLALAQTVHRQTEGNPLFVQEVLRYLVETGVFTREGGRWHRTDEESLTSRIPEGLRDVIGKRLSGLSPQCNQVLGTASVIGREFRLDVLQQVAGLPDEELFAALEEAKNAAVLEERSSVGAMVSFRSAHAFFRQTLYEELFAPRRIRLHQLIGRVLEKVHAVNLEEHAAEMGDHFANSSETGDLAKAIHYSEMAAKQAISVYAYGEAVRLREQVLKVQEILNPQDKQTKCDMLFALGEALVLAGEAQRYIDDVGREALSLADGIGDVERGARITRLAVWAVLPARGVTAYFKDEGAWWVEQADKRAQSGTIERVWADCCLGMAKSLMGQPREASPIIIEALNSARLLHDSETLWFAASARFLDARTSQEAVEQLRLAEEFSSLPRTRVSAPVLAVALIRMSHVFLSWGQRSQFDGIVGELEQLSLRTDQPFALLISMSAKCVSSFLDGHLAEAVSAYQTLTSRGEQMGLSEWANLMGIMVVLRPMLYLGKSEGILLLMDRFGTSIHLRLLYLAHTGHDDEATAILDQLEIDSLQNSVPDDDQPSWSEIMYLEAATIVGHRPSVKSLLRRSANCVVSISGQYSATCVHRHLGAAAAMLGETDRARAYYVQALEVARQTRFRPEVALTRLQLAELLLEHYPSERSQALEHLESAFSDFKEMKMQPALDRVERLRNTLNGDVTI